MFNGVVVFEILILLFGRSRFITVAARYLQQTFVLKFHRILKSIKNYFSFIT